MPSFILISIFLISNKIVTIDIFFLITEICKAVLLKKLKFHQYFNSSLLNCSNQILFLFVRYSNQSELV